MARYGQTINSDLLGYYTAEQSVTKNQLAGVDYWTEDNQGAYFPRPGTGDEQKTVYPSLRVHDGSFIKIKNITLGYTLPRQHFPQGIDGEMPHLRYGLQSVHLCERQTTEGHRPRNERFGRVSHLSAICIWS